MKAFIYLLSFLIKCFKSQSVSYDFTIIKHTQSFNLYMSLLSTEELCLGTPYQCVKAQFDPSTSLLVIHDKSFQSLMRFVPDYHLYDNTTSSTYKSKRYITERYIAQKMIEGLLSTEKIKFGPLELDNAYFFLARNWTSEQKYSSIGLSSNAEDTSVPNLIVKLRKANLIRRHEYIIYFNDDTKGVITFGSDVNNDNNSYQELFELKAYRYYIGLYFHCYRIFMSNNNYTIRQGDIEILFDETYKYIQMPSYNNDTIYEAILSKFTCEERFYLPEVRTEGISNYSYYLCLKESVMNYYKQIYLSDLIFQFVSGNLTLRKEDLFTDSDDEKNYVIFNIVFKEGVDNPKWIIGYPITKYLVIHRDLDYSNFTLYLKKGDQMQGQLQELNNNNNSNYSIIKWLCIIIILMISIGLLFIALGSPKNKLFDLNQYQIFKSK